MWSLRTSQCTAAPHPGRITVQALVVHATADATVYESNRALHDAIAADDKTLEFIKADHFLTEPEGARAQAADLIAGWVTSHGGWLPYGSAVQKHVSSRSAPGPGQPPAYPIASVDHALRLLMLFRDRPRVRLSEASEYLGVAHSTAHRLMAMLAYHGFVRQEPGSRAYLAGPALVEIGLAAGARAGYPAARAARCWSAWPPRSARPCTWPSWKAATYAIWMSRGEPAGLAGRIPDRFGARGELHRLG